MYLNTETLGQHTEQAPGEEERTAPVLRSCRHAGMQTEARRGYPVDMATNRQILATLRTWPPTGRSGI